MVDSGKKENSVIYYDELDDAIFFVCGEDSRTKRKYLRCLVRHGFIHPITKETVEDVKRITIETRHGRHCRNYRVEKGFKAYMFDERAIRIIKEYRKQRKLVSPVPPSRSLGCEGEGFEKYVCACSIPSEQKTSLETKESNAESIWVHVEKKEENKNNEERRRSCVPHTHIFLYKDKENLTNVNFPEFQIFYAEPLKSEPEKAKISWKGDSDG
ncbi:MAG TPA: hypothetical protein ENG10_00225 [Candidatus Bathyarchaeota archaeon]|nr:hypothetical protein [Candidatus Bathyarchaeota archaeon]HEX68709.1 hypothetical protein [Candidatus Bathyarchaeota archaeon]